MGSASTTVSLLGGALCPLKARLAGGSATLRHAADLQRSHLTSAYWRCSIGHHPKAFARWNGPLSAKACATSTCRRLAFLRKHKIDLGGRKTGARATIRIRQQGLPMWSASTRRPPDNAVVICVDETGDPGAGVARRAILSCRRTHADGHSHDYKRPAPRPVSSAFVGGANGQGLGAAPRSPARKEFMAFMDRLFATYPKPGSRSLSII